MRDELTSMVAELQDLQRTAEQLGLKTLALSLGLTLNNALDALRAAEPAGSQSVRPSLPPIRPRRQG